VPSPLVRYRGLYADNARWDGFELRPDDIVISTPPKSGTTWTQTICALLVFQTPELPAPIDELSPWLEMLTRSREEVVALLDAQTHRRFIKSHTPLDGLPWDDRVTFISVGRDPRDVAISNDHHDDNTDHARFIAAREQAVGLGDLDEALIGAPPERPDGIVDRFWEWIDDPRPATTAGTTLRRTMHHHVTFWEARDRPNVVLLHYDDLLEDREGQMRALAARLGIEVPEERWPALVEAAGFDAMRAAADVRAPATTHGIWIDTAEFFHRGTSGQWRDVLDEADVARYREAVARLAPPDVVAWVHHGALP
jgi:hypothetical protein